MGRKNLIRSEIFPYHVTIRCNNREPFHAPLEKVWEITCNELWYSDRIHGLRIHAYVLMPNHLHLIVSCTESDLGTAMRDFIRQCTREINHSSKRSGRVFGGRYHWSLISDQRYFFTALKYVYRNPMKAKICPRAEEYSFSSLNRILGMQNLKFPLAPSCFGITDADWTIRDGFLDWINLTFTKEKDHMIQSALRKNHFTHLIDRTTRKEMDLGSDV